MQNYRKAQCCGSCKYYSGEQACFFGSEGVVEPFDYEVGSGDKIEAAKMVKFYEWIQSHGVRVDAVCDNFVDIEKEGRFRMQPRASKTAIILDAPQENKKGEDSA